jgi:cyclomaltodextrinase
MSNYPQPVHEVSFNLLDSHDTSRLLTLCNEDINRMKLAALFQFTFFGVPCIYYGDEIGMTGGPDPDCRKCMVWDEDEQDRDLLAFYRTLIALRLDHSALRTGTFRFLYAEAEDNRLMYERMDNKGHFVVAFNVSSEVQSIKVQLKPGIWTEALGGGLFKADGETTTIPLPAFGYAVLQFTEAV